ncbi:MAG: zinc ribbon domain-containing protein [Acidibacter sp.]|jgi:putative FmdB family regulatory protein|nr:zinc ribbon domain-containing protein [Acidibacter sp.]
MPFYEYQCSACGEQTEVMQKISDKPLRKCPECGKNTLVKLISAPVFRLKGSGWYETDFKSENDKKRNLAGDESTGESKSSDQPADKTAAKSADKPAEKSADKSAEKSADKPATKSAKPKAKPVAKAKLAAKSKAPARKSARR